MLGKQRDYVLSLAALLAELPIGQIESVTRSWGGSNLLRKSLLWLSRHHRLWQQADMSLAQLKRLMANRDFGRLLALWKAQERIETGRHHNTSLIARRASRIPQDAIAPPPLLTGSDLKKLGLREGRQLGQVLARLHEAQLEESISTPQQAMELAQSLMGKDMGRRGAESAEKDKGKTKKT
jgi:DNA-binding transcriptional MerR regulator